MMTRHCYSGSLNKSYESLEKAILYRKDLIAYEDVVYVLLSYELKSKDGSELIREASNK